MFYRGVTLLENDPSDSRWLSLQFFLNLPNGRSRYRDFSCPLLFKKQEQI